MRDMDPARQLRSLRIHAMALSVALIVQYALGMRVNLFISFPENAAPGDLWHFAWSQPGIAGHIVLAVLILLGALVYFVRALIYRRKPWVWSAVVGLIAVLAAGGSGAAFVSTQSDAYSYVMSIAFILALIAYGWPLIRSNRDTP